MNLNLDALSGEKATAEEQFTAIVEVPPQGISVSITSYERCHICLGDGNCARIHDSWFNYRYEYDRIEDPLPLDWVKQYLEIGSHSHKYVLFTMTPGKGKHLHKIYVAVSQHPWVEGWAYIDIRGTDHLKFLHLPKSKTQLLQGISLGKNRIRRFFTTFEGLTNLRVAHIETPCVEDLHRAFHKCPRLEDIKIGPTLDAKCFSHMFAHCTSLREVSLQALCEDAELDYIFSGCVSLQRVRLVVDPNNACLHDTERIQTMFKNCVSLREVELIYDEGEGQ